MIKIFGSKPWMPVRISVKPCPYTIYSEVFVFPFITSLYVVKVWVESNWMGGFHSERHLHERVAAWNWKSQAPELLFLRRSLSDTNTITVTDTNTNTKHRYKYICTSEWQREIERVKRQNYCSFEDLCRIKIWLQSQIQIQIQNTDTNTLHERVAAWNWKSEAPELLFLGISLSDTNAKSDFMISELL